MTKKKMLEDIRISIYKPRLANTNKQNRLFGMTNSILDEVKSLANELVYKDKIPVYLDKTYTDVLPFPARLSQVIGKAASAVARSIKRKVDKAEQTNFKKKHQLEILEKYNKREIEIDIKSFNLELDQRFVDIQHVKDTQSEIDYWIKIQSFPKGSFYIPVKITSHMRDLISRGYELDRKALRINSNGTFGFYFKKLILYKDNIITPINNLGADLGRNKAIVCSNGKMESTHTTGKQVKDILDIIMRRLQSSKNSKQTRMYLINQINYSLKHDIDWNNISFISIESLKDLKRYKKWGKKNHFWPAAYIRKRLDLLAREYGVRIIEVNAAYTSQECNVCGFIHKNNRNNERFLCMNCGNEIDADYNASINIYNRGMNSSSAKWNIISICNMNLRKIINTYEKNNYK